MAVTIDELEDALARAGCDPKGGKAKCPGHEDKAPSLSYGVSDEGKLLLHDHSGRCEFVDLVRLLELPTSSSNGKRTEPVRYPYRDAEGKAVVTVCRTECGPGCTWKDHGRRCDGRQGKHITREPVGVKAKVPLYRLPEVLSAIEDGVVVTVVEGEKSAEALWALGVPATTSPGGAGKWRPWHTEQLTGAAGVAVVADADAEGVAHAHSVVSSLRAKGIPADGWLPARHGGRPKYDLADQLAEGGEADDLVPLPSLELATAAEEADDDDPEGAPGWPVLHEDAYDGLLGEIAMSIAPYSEADPVALLATLEVSFGVAVGSGPWIAGQGRHPMRLNSILVGDTELGAKGTSRSAVEPILEVACPWITQTPRLTSGFGSGEIVVVRLTNLAVAVCLEHIGPGARGVDAAGEEHEVKPADVIRWLDERTRLDLEAIVAARGQLLIFEEEVSGLLAVAQREGSTMGEKLCCAYDGRPIENHTTSRGSFVSPRGAGVSILGHTTPTMLANRLGVTLRDGGFANRFLWHSVRESKDLPSGADPPPELVQSLGNRLGDAVRSAGTRGRVQRDEPAEAMWVDVYPELKGKTDETRALTAGEPVRRGRAHTARLQLTHALANGSGDVGEREMRAALARWRFCRASGEMLFGAHGLIAGCVEPTLPSQRDDVDGDKLLRAAEEAKGEGLGGKDLHRLFSNRGALARDELVAKLEERRLVVAVRGPNRQRRVWSPHWSPGVMQEGWKPW